MKLENLIIKLNTSYDIEDIDEVEEKWYVKS